MGRYTSTERIGVNATEKVVLGELDWIFREQPISDMGIDAHIESVENGNPTGKLLGVQIKTGESHFVIKKNSLTYYGSLTHLEYWLQHSLPVILVAYLPETEEIYWVQVSESTIERTHKAWKIDIPKKQKFNVSSKNELTTLLQGSPEDIRKRNLFLHVENMRYLQKGGKLVIYKEDWHHKSLSRGTFNLIKINPDGSETTLIEKNLWYTGYDIKELVEKVYPWATVTIDKDFYSENFSESFYDIYTDTHIEMNDIYPYATICGEVSQYRLELQLNSLGSAFLELFDYLNSEI